MLWALSTLMLRHAPVHVSPGLLLSVEVYDPDDGFVFSSAMGPVRFAKAGNNPGDHTRVVSINMEQEGAGIVTKPFCTARKSWGGRSFNNMRDYLKALNRPHPDTGEKGPRMFVRMVITDTASGQSELLASTLNPPSDAGFKVEAIHDEAFVCTGPWFYGQWSRWGASMFKVRLVLRVEPEPDPEVRGHGRMYSLRRSSGGG
jgi:hypothetical protein